MSKTIPKAKLVVTLQQFMHEIQSDLPGLMKRHPYGVSFQILADWYGESVTRIIRTCKHLEEQGVVRIQLLTNRTNVIVPASTPENKLNLLTHMQRQLLMMLYNGAKKGNTNTIRTSYAQLSRILDSSYIGVRKCVERCIQLGYIELIACPKRGKASSLLIRVNMHLFQGKKETS